MNVSRRDAMKLLAAAALVPSNAFAASTELPIPPLPPEKVKEYTALSPFEFKNVLIDLARKTAGDKAILNAGRGNPNFVNTAARLAFAKLHTFATELSAKGSVIRDTGFRPEKDGIAAELRRWLRVNGNDKGGQFLSRAVNYAEKSLGIPADDLVFQFTDAVLGDFYPDPSRMLPEFEKIVLAYMKKLHFRNKTPEGTFRLFATEGATAAMVYTFKSLAENDILNPGDHIAIITPIFSPYLEIPVLNDYKLVPVYVQGDQKNGWHVSDAEVAKLKDKRIKGLFLVNPMNPGAVSMSRQAVQSIGQLVKTERKDLVVLTDTVYAPFVDTFNDLLEEIPENVIEVYSFSKYYGVTGWRLGVIMLRDGNVVDRLIDGLPEARKKELHQRYLIDSTDPEGIRFIDRMVMDSRDVALAHTGGLSCPQQCFMALCSLYGLTDDKGTYKKSIQAILKTRMGNLYVQLPEAMKEPEGPDQTEYYNLIDLLEMAEAMHGKEFARALSDKYTPFDVLIHLAQKTTAVLLPGKGFEAPDWTVRISLANLPDDAYTAIGKALVGVMEDFHKSVMTV